MSNKRTVVQRIDSYLARRKTPATTEEVVSGVTNMTKSVEINRRSILRRLVDMADTGDVQRAGRKNRQMTWTKAA